MPLSPLNVAKSSRTVNPDRIGPGSVVEYEQHGHPILASVKGERKQKWHLINEQGQELDLDPTRLYLLPGVLPEGKGSVSDRLKALGAKADADAEKIRLEEVWELIGSNVREWSVREITEMVFNGNGASAHLATRRALLADKIYFKRRKVGFEPRSSEVVEELKHKAALEQARAEEREKLRTSIVDRINGKDVPLPPTIRALENYAAVGGKAENAAETSEFVEQLIADLKLHIAGKSEEKTLELLIRARHFDEHQNLDLIRFHRRPTFKAEVIADAERSAATIFQVIQDNRADFTHLYAITIDGTETRDMDDAITLERSASGYRLGVHISDISAFVLPDSIVEKDALSRASSIYCVDAYIPMLPPSISEDVGSLVAGEVRPTVSFLYELDNEFQVLRRDLKRSNIRVSKRLVYDDVDDLLYGDRPLRVQFEPELEELLLTLWRLTSALEAVRLDKGAIAFQRREMAARISPTGEITLESATDDTPARRLIGELMILANETAAQFAEARHFPVIFRAQDAPDVELSSVGTDIQHEVAREYVRRSRLKRSLTGVEPRAHFGLGLSAYTHNTSPIRRIVDLFNQRQITAVLRGEHAPYSGQDLLNFLDFIDPALDEVSFIQRERNRYWLLKYLEQKKITELSAVVVKIDGPRPLVEIDHIFILSTFQLPRETQKNARKHQLGDVLRLRIEQLNPRRGLLSLREVAAS